MTLVNSPGGALQTLLAALERAGKTWRHQSGGFMAQCPAHDDRSPSLSIGEKSGKVVMFCHAQCDVADILAAIGLTYPDLFDHPLPEKTQRSVRATMREFPYPNAAGELTGITTRQPDRPDGKRPFLPLKPNPDGSWSLGASEELKATPYRLPELVAAIARGETIWVAEGERDVNTLIDRCGVAATSNQGGAGKWGPAHAYWLRGADVVICQDRDTLKGKATSKAGERHSEAVIATLVGIAASVRIVEPEPPHKDVTGLISTGGTLSDLVAVPIAQPNPGVADNVVSLRGAPETNGQVAPDDTADLEADIDSDAAAERERRWQLALASKVRELRLLDEARKAYRSELAGPVVLPAPVLLTDLLAEPDADTRYRIDGLLPVGGRVVLAAQFKAGKSTAVGNLVRCLADGGLFLGAHQVNPAVGRVVLLDNEMPRETIKTWLRDQGIINTGNVAVIPCRGSVSSFNILDPDVRSRWVELIRAYGPGVLLLDCLRPVMDALGLDENHDAGQVLGAMDEIAERAGASELFVVHHMGHSNERSRGDSRIRDWPDVEWRLVRKDDDPSSQRFFTAYGRDVDVPETALEYDPRTRHLILAGGSRVDVAAHSLIPGLVDLLADQPGMTKAAIEDRVMDAGVSRSVVRATLAEAIDQGLVRAVPGPKTSVLHYVNPAKRTNQDVGQSVSSLGRRSSGGLEKQVREASSNSRPPEDQISVSPGRDSSSPGRRQAADLAGELGRVKAEGLAEHPPVGGAPAGGLNGQVSGLEEDRKKTISGGLELGSPNKARQDLGPGGDAWVHAYLTTAPQTAERLAADLDATPGAVHAALARLGANGNAQRHPGRPDESAQWSLPKKREG